MTNERDSDLDALLNPLMKQNLNADVLVRLERAVTAQALLERRSRRRRTMNYSLGLVAAVFVGVITGASIKFTPAPSPKQEHVVENNFSESATTEFVYDKID